MKQVVIENPVINSPFEEPKRHFLFSEEGITNEIVEARRESSYFVPIPRPKKKGKQKQLSFQTEWTQDRLKANEFINHVRALEKRISCEITFPRLLGYRYEFPSETLAANFTNESRLVLSTLDVPTKTENAPKEAKVATARLLWVPAVNNHGGFGRWAFMEIRDPWNAKNEILNMLSDKV